MDVFVPENQYQRPGRKIAARPWSKVPAFPEDASAYLLEIVKFLTTGALILASGVLLLMLG
jgi:hypothetical protein